MAETITSTSIKPRLGFVGTGWIGLNRMKALLEEDKCVVKGIYDTYEDNVLRAQEAASEANVYSCFGELLEDQPDGVVIATPNAFHYEQCMLALKKGIPVFCQKPLARTAYECSDIIDAARLNNKLLGVDLSYRYTHGMQQIKELAKTGELGEIYAVDLVFHNAYGPDKAWFYNPELSGGGCVIDLGIHLADLALWVLNFPETEGLASSLFLDSKRISGKDMVSEDFAMVQMDTDEGTTIRLTCSWNLNACKDAEIKASFYGSKAAAVFENVNGSFYDFKASLLKGTSGTVISTPPDGWGSRALGAWVKKLHISSDYDHSIESYKKVAEIIDTIYGRNSVI